MFDTDLIGWELDDVLEGFEVDFVIGGMAIDSTGEPRDPLLDGDVRDRLDRAAADDRNDARLTFKDLGPGKPSAAETREALIAARKSAA